MERSGKQWKAVESSGKQWKAKESNGKIEFPLHSKLDRYEF